MRLAPSTKLHMSVNMKGVRGWVMKTCISTGISSIEPHEYNFDEPLSCAGVYIPKILLLKSSKLIVKTVFFVKPFNAFYILFITLNLQLFL